VYSVIGQSEAAYDNAVVRDHGDMLLAGLVCGRGSILCMRAWHRLSGPAIPFYPTLPRPIPPHPTRWHGAAAFWPYDIRQVGFLDLC
jgi:hypothetical protein